MSENVSPKTSRSKVGGPKKKISGGSKKSPGKSGATSKDKCVMKTKKALSKEEIMEKQEARNKARMDENTAIGICPFFKQDRGCGRVSCEGANFHFPDTEARREYVYRFCAHPEGYKTCPLQITLNHYYERKYAHHE